MKKNKLSLIAMILGILAFTALLLVAYAKGVEIDSISKKVVAVAGKAVVPTSLIMCINVAVFLNIMGYLTVNRMLTLISAIFYMIGPVLMPPWGFIGAPSMVLQLIAFAKMKNTKV